ncbi:MAG: TSUP family transporter [Sphingopyxis sp.]|uniref:TSUP family transporter n=1 Tax=Sphingopyxis sp. TaxID=1908224 RepID=UPI002AB8598A|nr:TSUP family transporter [Sphingopyxis sp.]MDZ3831533.1 TSUP family transporter [Sphingopyxis sp.]
MEFAVETVALLMAVAFVAGTIDAMAGGGGLLSIPALMAAGVPPVAALATNKLQSMIGTASACYTFWRNGHVDLARFAWPVAATFVGAFIGATTVQFISSAFLGALVPVLLIAMGLYFLLAPAMSGVDRHARVGPVGLALITFAIGFYDGFFGPGTGSFFTLALVALAGLGLVRAIGNAKLLNLTTNVAGLIAMGVGGHVLWTLGLMMAAANVAGNQLGARLAIRFGGRGVRPVLVLMSAALAIKLLSDPANPIWTLF